MGLMDYTAVELGKKIKAGEVSVLEAANAAMDAIDALEDKFNCYVTVQERAAVQAKAEELQNKMEKREYYILHYYVGMVKKQDMELLLI